MEFWIGWLCGLGTAGLHGWLWRRLRPADSVRKREPRPCSPTEVTWAQTRNFLYYDGTEMPVIRTYKEESDG